MAYTALKPCKFAGQGFRVGEIVPDELVHPGAGKNLIKAGVLATLESQQTHEVKTAPVAPEIVSVAVKTDEGTITLDVTAEGVQDIVSVLTSKVSETEKVIDNMTDNDDLILLHLCDSRKAIKEAAETRAKKLSESGEA